MNYSVDEKSAFSILEWLYLSKFHLPLLILKHPVTNCFEKLVYTVCTWSIFKSLLSLYSFLENIGSNKYDTLSFYQ
jgi:hypothetical protein